MKAFFAPYHGLELDVESNGLLLPSLMFLLYQISLNLLKVAYVGKKVVQLNNPSRML